MKSWIQTYRGIAFEPLEPDPMSIHSEDIAHALSNLCRFTGHTREFYSVAQHSVLASRVAEDLCRRGDALAPHGDSYFMAKVLLLHDASEAYLVDVPAPIKPHILGYAEIEARVMRAVAIKFCVREDFFSSPFVKHIDRVLLSTEKRDLFDGEPRPWVDLPTPLTERIEPWTPREAKRMFLSRFEELSR